MNPDFPVHPYAARFPMLCEEEINRLADSIEESGQLDPCVIDVIDGDEILLDGRNRVAACRALNCEPVYETLEEVCVRTGCSFSGPVAFIATRNLRRRHLDPSQAAVLALEAVEEMANGDQPIDLGDEAEDEASQFIETSDPRPAGRPKAPKAQAREQIEAETGVKAREIARAETLKAARPDLFGKVKVGVLNLHMAELTMQQDQAREAADQQRRDAQAMISGEPQPFRDAVARGDHLKDAKQILQFSELTRDERTHMRSLLAKGWSFSRAYNYMVMHITTKTTIKQLLGLTQYSGGRLEIGIDEYKITVEKLASD